jgi:hypothetical protein
MPLQRSGLRLAGLMRGPANFTVLWRKRHWRLFQVLLDVVTQVYQLVGQLVQFRRLCEIFASRK